MRVPLDAAEQIFRTWWRVWHLGLCKALAPLQATWVAFSQPVPAGLGQLLTQLLLCGSLAAVAAGLTHHWVASSLLYPPGPSAAVATVCGLLFFLGLGLVPAARCLLALSVPALCMAQGRRLLLSCSTAALAVTVVPNILANMGSAGQVLRCVTEGSLDSLLNTTHHLQMASRALGPGGHMGRQGLTVQALGNGSALRLHMLRVTQQVLGDFSGLEALAREAAWGTRRVLTGLLMLGLPLDSAWYLHRYLTDLRFDNIYATRQLAQQLAEAQAAHLLASPPAWLLRAARPRLTQGELLRCLLKLGLLALLLVATATMVATDHMAFLLAQAAVDWAQKLPAVPITLTVKYDAAYTILGFIPFLFNQPPLESPFLSTHDSFQWELRFTSASCPLLPARRPDLATPLAVGALQLVAGSTVLLETYARRLRHTIAASFFTAWEARRARHLLARLQQRHDRGRGQQLPLGTAPASATLACQPAAEGTNTQVAGGMLKEESRDGELRCNLAPSASLLCDFGSVA